MSAWDSIKGVVGKAAPVLGTMVGGPAGPAIGGAIAAALGVEESPDAVSKAMQSDPEAAIKLQRLQDEHERELRQMDLDARRKANADTHKTIRAELESDNFFKSGWRPMIGWVLAFALAGILGTLAYAIVQEPGNAAAIMSAASGVLMFMAGLLGYNAKKRSDDKALSAGMPTKGLGEQIQAAFGGKGGN